MRRLILVAVGVALMSALAPAQESVPRVRVGTPLQLAWDYTQPDLDLYGVVAFVVYRDPLGTPRELGRPNPQAGTSLWPLPLTPPGTYTYGVAACSATECSDAMTATVIVETGKPPAPSTARVVLARP